MRGNKEFGKYKDFSFRKYLDSLNWFIKISLGYANNKYYNLKPIKMKQRIILYYILTNYLNPNKYRNNIPEYIKKMFKNYCEVRVGYEWDHGPYSNLPGYLSFTHINFDVSMFNALRPFLFLPYLNKIISPKKVNKIFRNCKIFYDQQYDDVYYNKSNKWQYENEEWCKYKWNSVGDEYKYVFDVSFSSYSRLIKKGGNIVLNGFIFFH